MRTTTQILSLGLLTTLLLASLPAGQAFVSDVPLVGVYLRTDAAGKTVLGFAPADQTAAVSIPLLKANGNLREPTQVCHEGTCTPPVGPVPNACASAATQSGTSCAPVLLGGVTAPRGFTIIGNSALNIWLKADQTTLLESLQVVLQRISYDGKTATPLATYGLDTGQGGEIRAAPIQLGTTPLGLTLGSRSSTPAGVGDEQRIELVVTNIKTLTPSANSGPTQVSVVFGPSQPTGATLPVAEPTETGAFSLVRRGENTMGLYLGKDTLVFTRPTAMTPETRALGAAVSHNAPAELAWGSAKTDEASTIVGNAVYTIYVRAAQGDAGGTATPGAILGLQLRVSLKVNTTVFAMTTHAMPTPLNTASGADAWFVGSIPIPRTHVPEGTPINVGLAMTGVKPNGDVHVLFGSTSFASGFLVPVEGGGHYFPPPEPKVNLTVPSPTLPPPSTNNTTAPAPVETEPEPTDETPSTESGTEKQGGHIEAASKKDVSKRGTTPGPSLVTLLAALSIVAAALRSRK